MRDEHERAGVNFDVVLYKHDRRVVLVGEGGDHYQCLSNREGAELQSFRPAYHFCESSTEAKRMVGNAVPSKLDDAVARGLLTTQPL